MRTRSKRNIIQKFLYFGLNKFFDLLYNQLAWSYDFIAAAVSAGLWNKWVLRVSDLLIGPQILELGFGPGHLQTHITSESNSIRLFGLDSSHHMSRLATQKFKKFHLTHKLSIGLAQNLPYPSDCFHQVVATFPSSYIYSLDTLNEIKRVLKKSGSLIILYQAKIIGTGYIFRLADWLFRVTGQTQELDQNTFDLTLQPFIKAGFNARIQSLNMKASTIFIIIAEIG